jgi:hypothetical protein
MSGFVEDGPVNVWNRVFLARVRDSFLVEIRGRESGGT